MQSTFPPRRRGVHAGTPIAALLAALAAPDAFAQTTPEPETVVVSATRSNLTADDAPQTVLVIGKEDIARQLAISSNSSDVLASLLPSFAPSRGKMTGSAETLRGRTPLILVDGVPQSNPLRPTGREAHTVDYALVERIEVIQGANAVNGLGATGGTINIVTRRPGRGALSQSVDVQATLPTTDIGGDTASYKAAYRLEGRGDAFDYLFAASYEDQGLHLDGQGRPLGTDNTQGDLMDSRAWDVLAKLGYDIDADQRLQLSVNRYRLKSKAGYLAVAGDRARGIPTVSMEGEPPGTPPWNDVWTTALTYRHAGLAGMDLSAMVFNQEFEGLFGADNSATFQDPLIAPAGTLYDQSRVTASKYGSKVGLTKDGLLGGRLKVTGGFDTLYDEGEQDLYGTGRTYVPPSTFRNLSLFLQGEAQVTGALALHAGIRRERSDVRIDSYTTLASFRRVAVEGGKLDFNETLRNAGLVFKPLPRLSLFASYSEGFGMPDIGRVLRSINTPGVSVARLRDLQPILTRSAEGGIRVREGAWDLDASWFRSRSDLGARVATVNGAFVMAREKTRIDGFDAAASYRFSREHRARLAYARTNGRYDSDADGTLDAKLDGLNVAPDRVIASWAGDWNGRLSTFVQAQHAFSDTFDDPAMNFRGYTLVDASASWKLRLGGKLQDGELRLAMANVFDRMYITYFSQSALVEPKRYFAGRGRTVSFGYALRF